MAARDQFDYSTLDTHNSTEEFNSLGLASHTAQTNPTQFSKSANRQSTEQANSLAHCHRSDIVTTVNTNTTTEKTSPPIANSNSKLNNNNSCALKLEPTQIVIGRFERLSTQNFHVSAAQKALHRRSRSLTGLLNDVDFSTFRDIPNLTASAAIRAQESTAPVRRRSLLKKQQSTQDDVWIKASESSGSEHPQLSELEPLASPPTKRVEQIKKRLCDAGLTRLDIENQGTVSNRADIHRNVLRMSSGGNSRPAQDAIERDLISSSKRPGFRQSKSNTVENDHYTGHTLEDKDPNGHSGTPAVRGINTKCTQSETDQEILSDQEIALIDSSFELNATADQSGSSMALDSHPLTNFHLLPPPNMPSEKYANDTVLSMLITSAQRPNTPDKQTPNSIESENEDTYIRLDSTYSNITSADLNSLRLKQNDEDASESFLNSDEPMTVRNWSNSDKSSIDNSTDGESVNKPERTVKLNDSFRLSQIDIPSLEPDNVFMSEEIIDVEVLPPPLEFVPGVPFVSEDACLIDFSDPTPSAALSSDNNSANVRSIDNDSCSNNEYLDAEPTNTLLIGQSDSFFDEVSLPQEILVPETTSYYPSGDLHSALTRVMYDVPAVHYWEPIRLSSLNSNTSESLDCWSPRSELSDPHLESTSYQLRQTTSEDSVGSSQQLEDSGQRKRVTISTDDSSPIPTLPRRSKNKGILKKAFPNSYENSIYDVPNVHKPIAIKTSEYYGHDILSETFLGIPLKKTSSTDSLSKAKRRSITGEWFVPALPTSSKISSGSTDYLQLYAPNSNRHKSCSAEFIPESAYDCLFDYDSGEQKLKSLSLKKDLQSKRSFSDSLIYSRFTLPARFTKLFSNKSRKSCYYTMPKNYKTPSKLEEVTIESLYSDWLDGSSRHVPVQTDGPENIRNVVLAKTKKGFGFVLRGAKADQLKKLNVQFVPSEKMPALQYLDSVEKGSVSDKAGLCAGDFILEIDNVNVTHASHEQTVQIIKKCGDMLAMKVIRAQRRGDNSQSRSENRSDGMMTLPNRKSHPIEITEATTSERNGHAEDEQRAIEQLDATLANYDSDSRSTGSSGTPGHIPNNNNKDAKIASIRQRPSSSHFTSIQELDDMFTDNHESHYSQPFTSASEQKKDAKDNSRQPGERPTFSTSSSLTGDRSMETFTQPPPPSMAPPPPPSAPPPSSDNNSENGHTILTKAVISPPPPLPPANTIYDSPAVEPSSSAFASAIKLAANNRSQKPPSDEELSSLYASVIKKKPTTEKLEPSDKSAASNVGAGLSVEDQLRLAVAKRRTQIEQKNGSTTDSDRSSSVTPAHPPLHISTSEPTNFRELAEIKRQEWIKKKQEGASEQSSSAVGSSSKITQPTPPAAPAEKESPATESMSELQRIMNRLAVSQSEPSSSKDPPPVLKKKPPPPVFKKPSANKPIAAKQNMELSPLDEFPPPPPPDFAMNAEPVGDEGMDIVIPPPNFEVLPSNQFSPPAHFPQGHDMDNHSVGSSIGSDAISSVSQDGNRIANSVATSGYSSDTARSNNTTKIPEKDVNLWTTNEVGGWLDAIGLGEYKSVFTENCIEGETLVSMTKQDIKELGVEKVGHRVKLEKEIRKLIQSS